MYLNTTSCQGMQQIQFRDLLNHIVMPTAFFAVGFGIFYGAGFDFVLASAIFELEGGQWRLTNHWLLSDVLHSGSRLLNNIILANLLGFWLYQQLSRKSSSERTIALTKLVTCNNLAAICHLLVCLQTDPPPCILHNVSRPATPVWAMPGLPCTFTFCRCAQERLALASLPVYCSVYYLVLRSNCVAHIFSHTT